MAEVWMRSAFTAYADIFPADAPKPTLESMMEQLEPAESLVAVDEGEIVGLVHPHDGWLSHLYVDPSYWGRGIGALLHDVAVDALRANGCDRASLWVLRDNAIARAMYEGRGWQLTDVTRWVYEPGGVYDVNYVRDL